MQNYKTWLIVIACSNLLKMASTQDTNLSLDELCGDDKKHETRYDDVIKIYEKFTKRYTGKLSFIGDYAAGLASCQIDPLPPIQNFADLIPLAVGPDDYMNSLMCGACLKISARKLTDNKRNFYFDPFQTYYGIITDECIHCKQGDIRMYRDGDDTLDVVYEAIDCLNVPNIDKKMKTHDKDKMRIKLKQCSKNRLRLQLKNTILPTTSLELFHKDKWECMTRTIGSYYLLHLDNTKEELHYPIEARANTVTGQTLGFTINAPTDMQETVVNAQYKPFNSTGLAEKPLIAKCYVKNSSADVDAYHLMKRNMTIDDLHKLPNDMHLLTLDGHLKKSKTKGNMKTKETNKTLHPVKSLEPAKHLDSTYVLDPGKTIVPGKTFVPIKNSLLNKTLTLGKTLDLGETLDSGKMFVQPMNTSDVVKAEEIETLVEDSIKNLINESSKNNETLLTDKDTFYKPFPVDNKPSKLLIANPEYCSTKTDGRYRFLKSCESFLVCTKGRSFVKRCPKGLLYNSDELVCDWPNNVQCLGDIQENENFSIKPSEEEEVFTKKFVKNRKLKKRNLFRHNDFS